MQDIDDSLTFYGIKLSWNMIRHFLRIGSMFYHSRTHQNLSNQAKTHMEVHFLPIEPIKMLKNSKEPIKMLKNSKEPIKMLKNSKEPIKMLNN